MTKTISLSDEAYEALAGLKREGESFSDVALRVARKESRDSILSLAGAWAGRKESAEEMKAAIYKAREESLRPRRERR